MSSYVVLSSAGQIGDEREVGVCVLSVALTNCVVVKSASLDSVPAKGPPLAWVTIGALGRDMD